MTLASFIRAGLLTAALAAAAAPAIAQTPEPLASGWIMGGYVTPKHKPPKQSYGVQTHLVIPGASRSAGAGVTFGVTDAGQVLWMVQTDYQPSLQPAHVKRAFATLRPPLTAEQVPRFIMVCAWPLGDDGKPGAPIAGFAERDDTRTSIERDGTLQEHITLHWTSVSAARARDKFGKADLCGEVAKTKKSSATRWMIDRDGK